MNCRKCQAIHVRKCQAIHVVGFNRTANERPCRGRRNGAADAAVDIVEDAGFTAVEAVNAAEALSILKWRSDISLLFSDIQMPGSMDGLKLAHAVHSAGHRSRLFWCPAKSNCPMRINQPIAASSESRWR